MTEWREWRHITKLDPDRELGQEEVAEVCRSGTDAVMVGGTQGVTEEKVDRLLGEVRRHDVALCVEPSNPSSVVHGENYLFVPTVLNAGDVAWLVEMHKEWVRLDREIDWSTTVMEGYVVLNPDSAVARVTEAKTDQEPDDVAAYVEVAEHVFGLPVVYVEYSGTYGDPEKVEAAAGAVEEARLFYGGGIDGYEKAREMAGFANTIVVGNAVYEKGVDALRETVRGARDAG